MPCKWDNQSRRFIDNSASNWHENPGRSANLYHQKFKSITGYDPFKDLFAVKEVGAVFDERHVGFHARNTTIAQTCEILVAFSWAKCAPTDGGMHDTWEKSKANVKIHVCLSDL